ncbi:MAG: LysM peptidoglycan-binding domain-containing protein [Chloroflexi bacterium]|nr:LysM peptidoglycan-binding domain-containing protein [Chloroflexota bacterium]MCY3582989.1 LysM peptidoglycan-binding domain-containing protein [Chloroflexota bacterium]MCY3716893.1 LysM peptidoglycan-binding domain-containing protein [Chloroflexota bacterium]MDE2650107.1 LysM peptidoglycan-binding domain-containing protein [Chloroflexota bacterium]MXV94224.1 LysM peptidoglycan-binding domain-containing protein [Chloroflexota bacterium]
MISPAGWQRLPAISFCLIALFALGGGFLRGQGSAADDLVHTVVANETLTSIAEDYGIALPDLISRNNLDNPDILAIGDQILIFTAEEIQQRAAASTPTAPGEAGPLALGAGLAAEILAAAPVTPAAVPMFDPSDQAAELCLNVYADHNDNGMLEPGEDPLADASIQLLDTAGREQLSLLSAAQPHCQRDLPPGSYQLLVSPPAGFGLTTPAKLQVQLRAGSSVRLEIGAKQGRQTFAAPVPGTPVPEATAASTDEEANVLYGLSALLLLALAGLVLVSGFVLALFVRAR